MKKLTLTLFFALFVWMVQAQDKKDQEIISDSEAAKADFLKDDPEMEKLFDDAYGYIILPNVGKGGLGVGAASGNGVAFEQGNMIGYAKMTQVTVGLQAGGQAYSEVVFFEDEDSFGRFKANKVEMGAQVSAVAAKEGASRDVDFVDGVAVFTRTKGGLMVEASVGGQKFKFKKK